MTDSQRIEVASIEQAPAFSINTINSHANENHKTFLIPDIIDGIQDYETWIKGHSDLSTVERRIVTCITPLMQTFVTVQHASVLTPDGINPQKDDLQETISGKRRIAGAPMITTDYSTEQGYTFSNIEDIVSSGEVPDFTQNWMRLIALSNSGGFSQMKKLVPVLLGDGFDENDFKALVRSEFAR